MEEENINDLDLIIIFRKAKNFITLYYKFILVFIFLGTFLSIIYFYNTKNYYKTEFVTSYKSSSVYDDKIIENIFKTDIGTYLTEDNLHLNKEEIKKIKEDIKNIKSITVNTSTKNILDFKLIYYNKSTDLNSLKESILKLIYRNNFIFDNNKKQKEKLNVQIREVKEKIRTNNSIRDWILKNGKDFEKIVGLSQSNLILEDRKYFLEEEIQKIGNNQTIIEVYNPDNPERSLKSTISFGLVLNFFIAVVICFIHKLNKTTRKFS